MAASTGVGTGGWRILVGPPAGWHVEWQVKLDEAQGTTVHWGSYGPDYQTAIEDAWVKGLAGIDYQPGATQTYRLDFGAMTQTRTSCAEGWGTSRVIRRIFAEDESPSAPSRPSDEPMLVTEAVAVQGSSGPADAPASS